MDQAVGRDVEIRLPHLRPIRAAGDGRRDQQGDHDLYTASLGEPVSLPRRTIGKLRLRDVGTGLRDIRGGVAGVFPAFPKAPRAARRVPTGPTPPPIKTKTAPPCRATREETARPPARCRTPQ